RFPLFRGSCREFENALDLHSLLRKSLHQINYSPRAQQPARYYYQVRPFGGDTQPTFPVLENPGGNASLRSSRDIRPLGYTPRIRLPSNEPSPSHPPTY